MPTVSLPPSKLPGASRSRNARRELAKQGAVVFREAANSPRVEFANKLAGWGIYATGAYTLVLVLGQHFSAGWVQMTSPITAFVAGFIPAVRWVGADLVARGYPARAVYVENVVAFQVVTALFGLGAPFFGPSRLDGAYPYDLAIGNLGLITFFGHLP